VRPECDSWRSETGPDGLEYFAIAPGPILDQAMYARYRAIRAYLDAGLNVIADDVVWKREWLVDMVRLFEGYDLEVDTTSTPPNILAGELVARMRASPPPTAFARLRKRFQ
jgi:chloramphenicol 3-O phosphotransferase